MITNRDNYYCIWSDLEFLDHPWIAQGFLMHSKLQLAESYKLLTNINTFMSVCVQTIWRWLRT